MSRNIERTLLALSELPNFSALVYGMSYESDRAFFLFTNSEDDATKVVQEYRYNWITQTYTLWTRSFTAAIVNKIQDRMYAADSAGHVYKERKTFTTLDCADQEYTVTITAINSTTNTFTLVSAVNVLVGDVIQQTVGGILYSTQVTAVSTNDIIVKNVANFITGTATSFRSIPTAITFCPVHGGFSEYVKKWTLWQFFFQVADFDSIQVTMETDWSIDPEMVELIPIASGGWGTLPWGTFAWGVSTIAPQMIPTWPTRNTNYSHWTIISLALTQAFTSIALDGIAATFDITGTRGH